MSNISTWLRRAADPLLAGALWVLTASTVHTDCACRGGRSLMLAMTAAQTLPLVARRRHPFPVFLVCGLATIGYYVLPMSQSLPSLVLPFGALAALYTVASLCDKAASLIAGGLAVAGVAVALVAGGSTQPSEWGLQLALMLTAWTLGRNAHTSRAYAKELERKAVAAEQRRSDQEMSAAVAAELLLREERTRIARDIHDLVAHHVSMMVVQAEAGPLAANEEASSAAFAVIADTGRLALNETRRSLGLLRNHDQDSRREPQPGLPELAAVIARVNSAGIAANLVLAGTPSPEDAAVLGPTVHAVVQEALTNVVRHSGASSAHVSVDWRETEVVVRVADDGRGGASATAGHGWIGMGERARSHAGELRIEDGADGGLVVTAVLPVGPPQ